MRVAIAIIRDDKQRILITRRPLNAPYGAGLWEFPGGKLEAHETPDAALVREVKEEVGLEVEACDYLGEINHTYPHHTLSLLVYSVPLFKGTARCCEQQMDLRWVRAVNLNQFEFPEANVEIMKFITDK